MEDNTEGVIKSVYKKWKGSFNKDLNLHPDDAALACFLEGDLSEEEKGSITEHIVKCAKCAESVALQLKIKPVEDKEIPLELIDSVKGLVKQEIGLYILEVCIRLKEKTQEVINTTGDVLVGQELIPAAVLRSRQIKDFQNEVLIFKDFKEIMAQVKIENKHGEAFDLTVLVKDKTTQEIIKDLRITLLKENLELESYCTSTGSASFQRVLPGAYTVDISNQSNKLATLLIDILR